MGNLSYVVTEQKSHQIDYNQNNAGCAHGKKGVFFNLKHSQLLQSVLINTLLIKTNCFIDDLANLLNIDSNKLSLVWQGKGCLSEKKSTELITLYYALLN